MEREGSIMREVLHYFLRRRQRESNMSTVYQRGTKSAGSMQVANREVAYLISTNLTSA